MIIIKLDRTYKLWSLKSHKNLNINPNIIESKTIENATYTKCILLASSFFIQIETNALKLLVFFKRELSNLLWKMFICLNFCGSMNTHKYINAFYWTIFFIILFSYVTIFIDLAVLIVNLSEHFI